MTRRAIVTVGISSTRAFSPYIDRFRRTFSEYGGADLLVWDKMWPPGSPSHTDVHYAFKVFAVVEAARRGATSILWFDSSANAFAPLAPLWEHLESDGHILIEDANKLGEWSSDHSLAHFGVSRDEAMTVPLMCGTCWGVDLTSERSRRFVQELIEHAVPEHFNGTHVSRNKALPLPETEGARMSADPRCRGHRSDEVYMGLIARKLGMATHVGVEFIGGCGKMSERACVRSGYDLPVGLP